MPLFTGFDQWGRGDWDQFTFRHATPRAAMLRDGELPLWNPYVNGGNVLLAHPHCPAFSPWYLPTLVLGAPLGLRVSVVLFVVLGSIGMAVLLRRWDVSAAGSFLGGILFMMSSHFTLHITEGHLEWCVLGLIPWVLLCLLEAQRHWKFAILAGLVFASALLYGSVYIVAIFAPLLGIWSVLESVRQRSARPVVMYAGSMGLALSLSAVALLPRLEFLRANPRRTEPNEQVSPNALGLMLFDPAQAELYRATRDVRNPPVDELARLIPTGGQPWARPFETLVWHRLEVTLTTTSNWTYVNVGGAPNLWFSEPPDAPDKTPARLNSLSVADEPLSIKNPHPPQRLTRQATVYVQLPPQGDLRLLLYRGAPGATKLTVKRRGEVLIDALHAAVMPGPRTLVLPRKLLLSNENEDRPNQLNWYALEAIVRTTAPWCKVEVANCPYLFLVEPPSIERQKNTRLSSTALSIGPRAPGAKEAALRALLYVQAPEKDGVRIAVTEGPGGKTHLLLQTPQGDPLDITGHQTVYPDGKKSSDYVLTNRNVRQRLDPQPTPARWRLDNSGMTYDWHEYSCYLTWTGIALAVVGLVTAGRRQWPLMLTGLVAGLVVFGASLPINFWAVWKFLPTFASLQVPSRFLAAVVLVLAVTAGYGLDRLGHWMQRLGGMRLRRLVECTVLLLVYVELAVLGWNLFADIFVCPPRLPPSLEQFAQRYQEDDIRYASMYGAHFPYLAANSGVLREYENIAVPRGNIRLATAPCYLGEAYLEKSSGTAQMVHWSMSRVKVAVHVEAQDRLVLNQNYFGGWKVACRNVHGELRHLPAEPSREGLVSLEVGPDDQEVEFYYLPDSFVAGAMISSVSLLAALALLLLANRRSRQLDRSGLVPAGTATPCQRLLRSKPFGHALLALVVNAPFAFCHPLSPLVELTIARSLAINAVLFLVPGLPLVGLMIGRRWLSRFNLLWAMSVSLVVFLAVLVAVQVCGVTVRAAIVWNATWAITNVALLANVILGGPPDCGLRWPGRWAWTGILLFTAAYLFFLHGATEVVPVMDDHDFETQATAYSLLTRLDTAMLTDRNTRYYFAHPPLLHLYVAGSFLYFGRMDELRVYDEAWQRVDQAENAQQFEPPVQTFLQPRDPNQWPLHEGSKTDIPTTSHRITGVEGRDYLVEPELPGRGNRIPVQELEMKLLYDNFRHVPAWRLPTRTPNVFLAALTIGLLGCWLVRTAGFWWLALLVPLVYATSPEVYVRSSYGGYFAITNFAALQMLIAAERLLMRPGCDASRTGVLAGVFAALANHKIVLLPAALVVWQAIGVRRDGIWRHVLKAVSHPIAVGFAAGTALFWVYGLAISPEVFWLDHVRYHVLDRLVHYNPLGYSDYPSIPGLWLQLWQHTGYILLPLGVLSLMALCQTARRPGISEKTEPNSTGWRSISGLCTIWFILSAVAFSLIDWRQTKHLMPLLLPLSFAPARWAAAAGRTALVLVSIAYVALLLWNILSVQHLATNFEAFHITPAW